jgi:predicted acylesterase/phospholipase RssA
MIPYRIYLSGGGICAMAHVGALVELSKHIPLNAVKEWMGVSAGSFIAMGLCIGYTLEELTEISVRFDFTNIKEVDSIPGWILHFGLDTGDRLHRMIEACLHVKGLSSDFTFQECFQQFGLSLRVIATDLNEGAPKIFSPTDTPDYSIVNAVRASMSAPYYFQPFLCPVTGHYLIDGAVISNYPLFVVPKEEHARTLSILIRTSVEKVEDLMGLEIDEMITRPMNIALREKVNIEAKFYDAHCIQIQLGEINILDFSFDEETKNRIIRKGTEAVLDYVQQTQPKKRRNSI